MKFIKIGGQEIIGTLRTKFYEKLVAPIDGMWESLYIGGASAYLIQEEIETIGYCCINSSNYLLQIFLCDGYDYQMSQAIALLIDSKLITHASLSSIEPISFNACLTHAKSVESNTYCFQYSNCPTQKKSLNKLTLVTEEDNRAIKNFFKEQIEFEDNFGYTENLIKRGELYMIKESEIIIATGECRLSDSQKSFADLGVIVNKNYQKKGLGRDVLSLLIIEAQKANRSPICSTTFDNIASRKAIEGAGFYCSHIIFDLSFEVITG
jgi:predicted acetyltransferase